MSLMNFIPLCCH